MDEVINSAYRGEGGRKSRKNEYVLNGWPLKSQLVMAPFFNIFVKGTRQRWTEEEVQELERTLRAYIKILKTPSTEACMKAMKSSPLLAARKDPRLLVKKMSCMITPLRRK